MHMSKSIPLVTAAAAALFLAACIPPPNVPPPRFKPNPPYPPEQVDASGETSGESLDSAPPSEVPTRPGDYPTARKTANPNEVTSPYDPYNVIDVEGFHPGQLARDPSNQKIFRVP
jgi:hypothetical protein